MSGGISGVYRICADFCVVLTCTLFLDVFPCSGSGYINYTVYSHSPEMDDFNHTRMWMEGTSNVVPQATEPPPAQEMDVVETFLEHVEQYDKGKENCTKGTHYNLGKGVIRQYGLKRFKKQAMAAVNAANFYTRIWMRAGDEVTRSEYLFYTMVRSIVEGDPDIFAAGNCYDLFEYYGYYLFCPYAYLMEDKHINVKDLSLEYDYLGNDSEWFMSARMMSSQLENFNYTQGTEQIRLNSSHLGPFENDSVITVTYEDGHWSLPYFDCGGGDIWMMTYTVPFFGYKDGNFKFKGTSGIDIDLQKVDINQCPQDPEEAKISQNVFAGSHRCKNATTKCIEIGGLGFKRGSYKCVCKDGFYFPDLDAQHRYYKGTDVEAEFALKRKHHPNKYDSGFECLRCAPGCETCDDFSPCIIALNWLQRSIELGVSCLIMCFIPIIVWFTVQYRDVKVLKAASPVLLRIILLGAFLLYCPLIVGYFEASVITCCMKFWFRQIGFSISYGALLLKTWRISVVFRVRSAQRVKISDGDLIKRLSAIVFVFAAYLISRTIVAPPRIVQGKDVSGLKAFQCSSDWWDHSAVIVELLFLLWGVRLCIVVRKAPSEFNESRFISWAIYNEFLLSLFLNVSMIFLKSPFPTNPDLLYLVLFIHTQLTTTVTLAFLFGSKFYVVFKYRGKDHPPTQQQQQQQSTMLSRGSKYTMGANMSTLSNVDNCYGDHADDAECESFLEKDIQEEFRRLYTQLEVLKQRNMKLGNRHLQHKLSDMIEAAQKGDLPDSSPSTPNLNGKRIVINLDDYHESTNV
ncbi:probable G-protein coupled receptor CG31760 [Gigantopelta aegis]|uniref:probable G-protein coupled receptor CG31760 n=1 Tax=Gigantopelta aegis TaxID=1735272 RepID=UPI001B8873BE|nr:probable G-protein coupled receptor CG31760 [Gigantopelta aegis]